MTKKKKKTESGKTPSDDGERLKRIKAPPRVSGASATDQDQRTQAEEESLRKAQVRMQLQQLHQENEDAWNLLEQRKEFARKFVYIAFSWLFFVAIIILLTGFVGIPFTLSDSVLYWIMGTATANALAPAFLLAKYLFGNPR